MENLQCGNNVFFSWPCLSTFFIKKECGNNVKSAFRCIIRTDIIKGKKSVQIYLYYPPVRKKYAYILILSIVISGWRILFFRLIVIILFVCQTYYVLNKKPITAARGVHVLALRPYEYLRPKMR